MRSRHSDPLAEPERLIPRLYAYIDYIVGDSREAGEITRATIERAVRQRRTYNPKRTTPLAWIFGIARRCVADRYDEPFKTTGEELAELPDREPLPDGVDRQVVRAAVAQIGPRDRELIALRYGAGLTPREIGDQLDMRRPAVEDAIRRARGRIRAALGPRAAADGA